MYAKSWGLTRISGQERRCTLCSYLIPRSFFSFLFHFFFTVLLCNCAPQNKKGDVLAVPITRFLFSCLVRGALAPTALSVKGVATKEFEKAYFVPNDGEIFIFF
jgi:hypothetical protein